MKALKHIEQIRKYCDYLENHINNVSKAWKEVQEKCKDMTFIIDDYRYFTLTDAIANHDLSKFSEHEFIQYCNKFYPVNEPQEENGGYDKAVIDFVFAWQNHIKMNDHHWENWTKSEYRNNPYFDEYALVHMIVDWLAMSYQFNDSPRQYYEKNKDKINIPEECKKYMYNIFEALEAKTTSEPE